MATIRTSSHWLAARSRGPSQARSILLHAPSFAFQSPGGGENQLVQTGRHLEAIGVPIRLFCPWTDRLDRARLLHLFGMSREGLELARIARNRGVPVVLSPICWYEPRALWALEQGLARKCSSLALWSLRRVTRAVPGWRRELLHLADRLLPNSESEGDQLVRLFGADRTRITVVPNGVLESFGEASPRPFRDRFGRRDFILFVGRIEPRKNPLGVIRAARSLGYPLVVIGSAPPGCEAYEDRCRRAADTNTRFLQAMEHHDELLASAYAAARVFALPSWFETPGLAALEAALAGAAVVITPFGSTRDYFGDLVRYAEPNRPDSIRDAIYASWTRGPDPRLSGHVAANFLWSPVALRTAEVYDQVAP